MKRLFVRTLITLLSALMILIAVMAVVSVAGFRRSLDEWSRARTVQLEQAAREILVRFPGPPAVVVPEDVPLFVYDSGKELIFSNRGEGGRRRSSAVNQGGQGELIAVEEEGRLIGFYRSGLMRFENDAANSRFLNSLRLTIWLGLALALVIAVPFALLFSRSLSRPAVLLAQGLDRISRGDLSMRVPERGAEEIARIARSTNRLGEQLQRERSIRRQWVQDIAHDLRTPIAAMRAQFEGMRDGVLDLSTDRIDQSLKEIFRIETLVADLEELMRLESPEIKVSIEEVTAAAFIEEITERFTAESVNKQIRFQSQRQIETFRADPALLQRAVTNFLANALRHTPRAGTIELSIGPAEYGGTLIAVANSGEPIPPLELEKVFDRLYRGEYARSSPGSGLGLTIAKRIAELHGGALSIRNRVEGGVVVEMTLSRSA
ncbi:MAG: HAMP domain-containing protein [Spirochaetaceae bacterium]|nr:MAG: HAMP domain-containing protein [Spirochaetaceae bacterium]